MARGPRGGVDHSPLSSMRAGGGSNPSASASLAKARSMIAVGLERILAENRSSHSFHAFDPRIVIAFGCVLLGGAGFAPGRFGFGLAILLALRALDGSGASMGPAPAEDKPSMCGALGVSMIAVYA